MAGKFPYYFLLFALFAVVPARAQTPEQPSRVPGLFIAPLAEMNGYGRKGPAFGGGFAVGFGDGVTQGFRLLYSKEAGNESLDALEAAFFLRFYPFGSNVTAGFFFQIDAGAVLFAYKSSVSFPAEAGSLVLGLSAGGRFPLRDRWHLELAVRAGYPHIAGLGVSVVYLF